jgi:hypothetical protein
MVVNLLPLEPDAHRKRRGGGWFGHFRQQTAADRVECDRGSRRIINHFEVNHGLILSLTTFVVKAGFLTFHLPVDAVVAGCYPCDMSQPAKLSSECLMPV